MPLLEIVRLKMSGKVVVDEATSPELRCVPQCWDSWPHPLHKLLFWPKLWFTDTVQKFGVRLLEIVGLKMSGKVVVDEATSPELRCVP